MVTLCERHQPSVTPTDATRPVLAHGVHDVTGISLGAVVLDCPDPLALAEFYRAVLGGEVQPSSADWVNLVVDGRTLAFQRAANHQPPSWPDGVPQQFHLDLEVTEYAGPHALVISLGATALDPVEPPGDPGPQASERTWRVYADPAGHPFCLCIC